MVLGLAVTLTGGYLLWAFAFAAAPQVHQFEVVNTFPHDPRAYCQGLVIDQGILYEGTGKYGESTLRRVELDTGRVLQSVSLPRRYFGEGITIMGDKIYQLTWKSHVGFVYDKKTLNAIDRFRIVGEGWGLTHDGTHLIMSDGSSTLRFLDPQTFAVKRRLLVQSQGRRVPKLNELEYVNGEILANVWYEDYIVRIDPVSGKVVGWIDLRNLLPGRRDREAVLNGIAYDADKDRLFVTGKNWPKLFEIRVKP